jgi:DDE_Tnp_1-associated
VGTDSLVAPRRSPTDLFAACAISTHFADLPDPRVDRTKRHTLLDIVAMALRAVIWGPHSWVEIEPFGRAKRGWLGTFLAPPHCNRSHDRTNGRAALHLLSAWATTNHLVLGQVAAEDHANELVAIPALLDSLALDGCIFTIDGMGCYTEIADYVLALKDNH